MTTNGFHLQMISRRLRPVDRTMPIVVAALESGIDSVQLRDEGDSMTAMIQALKAERAWDRDRLVINGDPKVAGAHGVRWLHLGSNWLDQTPPFARFARIGMSVHSLEDAIEAEGLGVDYVTFGHVYSTHTHPGEPERGLAELAEVVEKLGIPVLAIGGIHHGNVGEVLETGCAGIAVISAIVDHPEPAYATSKLIETMEASTATPRFTLSALPPSALKGSTQ